MNYFTYRFWFTCGLATILCLLAGGFAVAQTPPPDRDEVILSGFLTCHLSKDSERDCPARLHYLNLNQGTTYAFRIDSTEFDTRLTIEDAYGNLLAADTDCMEEDLYGCIWFRPPATGQYRLVVTALPPVREGFYQISMRELPSVMRVDAALTNEDPAQDNCHFQTHEVTLTEGQRYIIHLESADFASCLKLLSPEGMIVAFDDEGAPNRPARIIYEAPRTGTYRLVAASTAPKVVGTFMLSVCSE